MAFGLFKGTLMASLLLLLFSVIPLPQEIRREEEKSLLYQPVRSVAPAVFNFLKHLLPQTKDFYEEVKEGFSLKSKELIDQVIEKEIESLEKDLEDRVNKK